MLPIESKNTAWALVEIYGSGRRFDEVAVERARALAAEAGEVLERLSQPGQ